jgi:hypothetical protein
MLLPYVNFKKEGADGIQHPDFVLTVCWLLAALKHGGPYPALDLVGEAGTAKSTLARMLRALTDPHKAALRAPPRDLRDVAIAGNNSHCINLDNLSVLPTWLSDTLARVATGQAWTTRKLYTNDEEEIFEGAHPCILNGIEKFVIRGDLADRCISLLLRPIPDKKRKPEKELWAQFERDRPYILGALLDVMVHGLKQLPNVHLSSMSRMADFTLWATACETALWEPGTFEAAYTDNRMAVVADVIDADPVAVAVRRFMRKRKEDWTGRASALLIELKSVTTERQQADRDWPKNGRGISDRLRRAAPALRKRGVDLVYHKRSSKGRFLTLAYLKDGWSSRSLSSLPKDNNEIDNDRRDDRLARRSLRGNDGDDGRRKSGTATVIRKSLKNKQNDGHDHHDHPLPSLDVASPKRKFEYRVDPKNRERYAQKAKDRYARRQR